ncbi:hypothetical protein BC628DRAFT_1337903 [Trametes gibbosa]|nr:hypothetical protein BC628DRAFT_1337903 [Trametes gibbosa]
MPLGSIAKRFRRSRHSEQRTEESGGIRPATSAGQGRGGEHAPTLSEESQPGFLAPDNAAEFQSTSVQMSIPMFATAQAVEIEADMVEATEDRRSDGASVLEEPSRALSLLGQEIEQRYNTRPRDAAKSEGHAEELMHVRIDPVFKHIDIKQAIEAGVDRFSDSIPILRKALSDLSKIHPIVTVAVLAFEAVIELEITRRENDRRVTVLFVEMKQVMSVITHFKELRADDIGRDGRMLGVRLRELAEGTAEDIKHCANLCDAFLKSKMLLRVLKGPLWAERFATSMQRFARRKEEYSLALAMHTADTTTKMAVDIESINYKQAIFCFFRMQLMHDLFQKYMTSSERALAAEVEKEGGLAKVRNDDAVLRRLMGTATVKDSITGVKPTEDRDRGTQAGVAPVSRKRSQYRGLDTKARSERSFGLDDLKRELREDLDDTIERNFAIFLRKYDFQAQLMSDRIIHAVEAAVGNGTHSRIKNADLQRLWREMNWTGVVKGRILVHALREHYSQDDFVTTSPEAAAVMSDKWALDYLNIAWLHPIMEAIDDDTSGYISVSEVNRFMQRLPPELCWRWVVQYFVSMAESMISGRIACLIG